jgi:hypothetical protein
MKKRYFGAAAMAAAAAGVDLGDAEGTVPDVPETPAAEATPPAVEAEAAGTPAEAPEVPAADAGALALLSTQLKEKDTALLEAKMELAAKDKELAGMPALKKIVAETVNNWAVALGGSADTTLSDKDVAVLESLYQTTLARTVEAFKIGGISAQGEDVDTTPAAAGPTRFDAALSKAASLNQKK